MIFILNLKQLATAALTVMICLSSVNICTANEPTVEFQLLQPRPDVEMQVNRPRHSTKLAYCKFNFEDLEQAKLGTSFEVELSGKKHIGLVEEMKSQMNGYSVNGFFEDDPGSFFTISVVGEAAAGSFFVSGKGQIRLRYGGPQGLHYLHEIISSPGFRCGLEGEEQPRSEISGRAEPAPKPAKELVGEQQNSNNEDGQTVFGGCVPPPPTFDIMMAYTQLARMAAGGEEQIRAECLNAAELTEFTYATCGLGIRVNVVWLDEVVYDENGTYRQHRDRLVSLDDGILDEVHGQRNAAGADFVALVVNDFEPVGNGSLCGIAVCGSPADSNEPNGEIFPMTVNRWTCIADNLTLAHEIGHNIGLNHDEGACSTLPNAFGRRFTIGIIDYRTVMGTGPAQRIPYYSSPNCVFSGVTTGTPTRNNAGAITLRRGFYEGMRLTRMDVFVDSGASGSQNGSFSNPFDTVAEGVNRTLPDPVADLPVLRVNAGSYGETLTINKPMIIQSCGGTAIIGN